MPAADAVDHIGPIGNIVVEGRDKPIEQGDETIVGHTITSGIARLSVSWALFNVAPTVPLAIPNAAPISS